MTPELAVLFDDDELAGPNVPDEIGADDVQRTCLRSKYPAAGGEPSDDEGTHTVRITDRHDSLLVHRGERVRPMELRYDQPEGFDEVRSVLLCQ
jgi:hypothetical protein